MHERMKYAHVCQSLDCLEYKINENDANMQESGLINGTLEAEEMPM